MPIEDLELYHEAKYRGILPQELVRQLATLASRVLEIDGRESVYVDENGHFRMARIARLDNMAITEANRRVAGYLIELNNPAASRLRQHLFAFEADDLEAPADWRLGESGTPDFWYNPAAIDLMLHLDRRA
jgi:hypothetical protein